MVRELGEFLTYLETAGELVRIREELSPRYEVGAAIKYAAERSGKAVLCERPKGYDIPVVGNLLGSWRRLAMAFGVAEGGLAQAYQRGRQNPIKPQRVQEAPVQEVVTEGDVDILAAMPVLTHYQRDASPYLTSAFTVARDPETGLSSMGLHRVQIKDRDTVGLLLATPPLSTFLARAEALGRPLEIAIVSGADPVSFFASCVRAPQGIDKYDLAGGFLGRPLEVVKARTVDLEVPAQAQFVLEGATIPGRREPEGPFGESTGYYFTFENPVAKIKAITHRRRPIYHALVAFGPEEPVLMDLGWEVDNLPLLRSMLPQVRRARYMGLMAVAVQIDKQSDQDALKVIDALLDQSYIKLVVVVDDDVNIDELSEVLWAVTTRVRPDVDVTIRSQLPGAGIDPCTVGEEMLGDQNVVQRVGRVSKMGIDATKPLAEGERFERVDVPAAVKARAYEVVARALGG